MTKMTKIHKMMLNLYSTIFVSIITNAFMVTLHSNIKKKVNRKVQEKPQAEAAANPRHQEKRKCDTD